MKNGYFKLIIVPSRVAEASLMDADRERDCSKILLSYQPIDELFHRKYRTREPSESSSSELFLKKFRAREASESSSSDVSSPKQVSCVSEEWNSEQIDEFVRKLGFLEAEKVRKSVETFQDINQVCMHACVYLHDAHVMWYCCCTALMV